MTAATGAGTAQRPLSGIRILDLTIALSGPLCTLILAGLGAEVVKIEPPGGREMGRFNPPFLGSGGLHFGSATAPDDIPISVINRTRNKKSMTLDLKTARGLAVFLDLARHCDVVVQNFSDGTADRLGIGYRDVQKVNPAAVYCSLSGLGEDNDQPELKAMDVIIQALSGIMQATGEPGGPRRGWGSLSETWWPRCMQRTASWLRSGHGSAPAEGSTSISASSTASPRS